MIAAIVAPFPAYWLSSLSSISASFLSNSRCDRLFSFNRLSIAATSLRPPSPPSLAPLPLPSPPGSLSVLSGKYSSWSQNISSRAAWASWMPSLRREQSMSLCLGAARRWWSQLYLVSPTAGTAPLDRLSSRKVVISSRSSTSSSPKWISVGECQENWPKFRDLSFPRGKVTETLALFAPWPSNRLNAYKA